MLVNDHPIPADLIELIMLDCDVIMGIDCLVSSDANIDCYSKIVRFNFLSKSVLEWNGNAVTLKGKFVSYIRDRKLIAKGCIYHMVHVKDTDKETIFLQSILS